MKRILPDWLCLPNKLGGAAAPSAPPPARYAHVHAWHISYCPESLSARSLLINIENQIDEDEFIALTEREDVQDERLTLVVGHKMKFFERSGGGL